MYTIIFSIYHKSGVRKFCRVKKDNKWCHHSLQWWCQQIKWTCHVDLSKLPSGHEKSPKWKYLAHLLKSTINIAGSFYFLRISLQWGVSGYNIDLDDIKHKVVYQKTFPTIVFKKSCRITFILTTLSLICSTTFWISKGDKNIFSGL